jgi:two-component system nitrogen regulation response regulator GlnG
MSTARNRRLFDEDNRIRQDLSTAGSSDSDEGNVKCSVCANFSCLYFSKNDAAACLGYCLLLTIKEPLQRPLFHSKKGVGPMSRILVIDDDRSVRHLIAKAFDDTDVEVVSAASAEEGLRLLGEVQPDVVLLDILLPESSGLELFEQIRALDNKLPVIFITSLSSSETAIKAMTLGAFDYLVKPLDLPRIRDLVRQALEIRRLMSIPVEMPGARGQTNGDLSHSRSDTLVGNSQQMQEVYKAIGRVAPQDVTVLIRGESGTGKELVARALYQHSPRVKGQFLAVNCAAIPDALLESELFGHEKGSFTGADQRRIGKFEQCSGGTLFLDEIGDMSPLVQSKVLRVLQSQQFERVGGNHTITTDVRVIAATNRDLEKMVDEGTFRSDLYYRLSGFTIQLAPLRERREDLLPLLENYLALFSKELNKDVHGISPEAMDVLLNYSWPGNVRELQNVLKQTLLRSAGHVIIPEFIPERVRVPDVDVPGAPPSETSGTDLRRFVDERLQAGSNDLYSEALEFMDRYVVTRVLRVCDGNQSKAARVLGITRGCLRSKVRALKVSIDTLVQVEGEPCEV